MIFLMGREYRVTCVLMCMCMCACRVCVCTYRVLLYVELSSLGVEKTDEGTELG